MSKHTKGPWRVEKVAGPVRSFVVVIPNHDRFTVGQAGGPDGIHAIDEANARLIAAAPDLLAALQTLIADRDVRDAMTSPQAEQVRAALVKAGA